jgi:hypothetical protein
MRTPFPLVSFKFLQEGPLQSNRIRTAMTRSRNKRGQTPRFQCFLRLLHSLGDAVAEGIVNVVPVL